MNKEIDKDFVLDFLGPANPIINKNIEGDQKVSLSLNMDASKTKKQFKIVKEET